MPEPRRPGFASAHSAHHPAQTAGSKWVSRRHLLSSRNLTTTCWMEPPDAQQARQFQTSRANPFLPPSLPALPQDGPSSGVSTPGGSGRRGLWLSFLFVPHPHPLSPPIFESPLHPRDTPRLPPQSSISAPAPSHRAFCFLSPSSAHSPRRVRTDATMEILKILQDLVIFRKLPRPLKQLPKPALLWLSRHLPRHPTRAPTTQVLRSALVPARAVPSSSPTSDPPPGLPEPKEPSWPVPHCLQGPAAWGIFSGLGNTAAPPDPGQGSCHGAVPWGAQSPHSQTLKG